MKLFYPLEFTFDEDVEGHLLIRVEDQKLTEKTFINLLEAGLLTFEEQCQIIKALSKSFLFMPQFEVKVITSETISTPYFYKLLDDEPKRVTFFGGSFNPFHSGHLSCIDLTPEDPIIVIPDINPLKEPQYKSQPLLEFVNICHHLIGTHKASVYPGFLTLNQANPTIDWFRGITIPEKNLIIGDDSFLNFDRWNSYHELLELCHTLYVVPRIHSKDEFEKQKMRFLNLGVKTKMVRLPEHLHMTVSSTELRKK